jgi:hypothetical protein
MKKAILTVLLIGAWSCCSAKGTDAATPASKPTPAAPAQVAQAPLSVTLEGRPDQEGVQLLATVQVTGRLAAPIDFAIEWDGQAQLVQGSKAEVIEWEGASGTIQKSFILVGNPTEVRVKASSISQSMGATAKAAWPPRSPSDVPAVEMTPIKPVKINGLKVDKAVPLD